MSDHPSTSTAVICRNGAIAARDRLDLLAAVERVHGRDAARDVYSAMLSAGRSSVTAALETESRSTG